MRRSFKSVVPRESCICATCRMPQPHATGCHFSQGKAYCQSCHAVFLAEEAKIDDLRGRNLSNGICSRCSWHGSVWAPKGDTGGGCMCRRCWRQKWIELQDSTPAQQEIFLTNGPCAAALVTQPPRPLHDIGPDDLDGVSVAAALNVLGAEVAWQRGVILGMAETVGSGNKRKAQNDLSYAKRSCRNATASECLTRLQVVASCPDTIMHAAYGDRLREAGRAWVAPGGIPWRALEKLLLFQHHGKQKREGGESTVGAKWQYEQRQHTCCGFQLLGRPCSGRKCYFGYHFDQTYRNIVKTELVVEAFILP